MGADRNHVPDSKAAGNKIGRATGRLSAKLTFREACQISIEMITPLHITPLHNILAHLQSRPRAANDSGEANIRDLVTTIAGKVCG